MIKFALGFITDNYIVRDKRLYNADICRQCLLL